jgi:hypothetical protein
MNDFQPICECDPTRPECAVGQTALQRFLDGEADWDNPEAAAHRLVCVACREELALVGLFQQPTAVIIPADLSDRVLTRAISAHRRAWAFRYAGAAMTMAAAVVVAVFAFRPPPPNDIESRPVAIMPATKLDLPPSELPPKPLGESVSEARDAIVSLTKRTANETRDQSALLLPNPKMPETPSAGDGLDPLADARAGAARSVEPIRDSARRALSFFARPAEPPQRRN